MLKNRIKFPKFSGIRCSMMPFIQGDPSSLPPEYRSYADIIEKNYLERGEIGHLTIHESYVKAGTSQRGYNSKGINRNVHIEVGRIKHLNSWGGGDNTWGSGSDNGTRNTWGGDNSWGGQRNTILADETKVLICNSLPNTCKVWDVEDRSFTKNGDLSEYIDRYPEETGRLIGAGEVEEISIFTPHECINQNYDSERQFFRIVGKGVKGRESYFTINPLVMV